MSDLDRDLDRLNSSSLGTGILRAGLREQDLLNQKMTDGLSWGTNQLGADRRIERCQCITTRPQFEWVNSCLPAAWGARADIHVEKLSGWRKTARADL